MLGPGVTKREARVSPRGSLRVGRSSRTVEPANRLGGSRWQRRWHGHTRTDVGARVRTTRCGRPSAGRCRATTTSPRTSWTSTSRGGRRCTGRTWQGNERTLTFGDMQALTNRTANALRAYGVSEGDRVAVMLPPLPETAAAFLATYKLGGVLLSLSVLYGDDSIVHRLRDCSAKVVVTDAA
ncbi:MAG: acyl-CoA synthetase, partial [Actinobacteria bacterium]